MIKLAAVAMAILVAAPAQAGELETVFFKNDPDKVEQAAQAMLKRAPADPEANAWLAETAMKQGKWATAQTALEKAGTGTLTGLLAHGDFAWYTGQMAEAEGYFRKALAIAPTDTHAKWGVSSALLHQDVLGDNLTGALDLAEELEKQGDKLDPDFHAWVQVLIGACVGYQADKGSMLDKLRLAPRVKGAFERALALSPKNPNALTGLGRYYLLAPGLLGDSGKAVEYLGRANDMDPFFYLNDAYYIRALLHDKQTNKAKAEAAFYRAKFQELSEPAAELARVKI
ncbi:MAG: transrane and repeat-containing protein [Cyanobacteria bacterium RYN_339]|nr:transrane and repeat-containing protein [Cyanobacteria bacterium RYN_339]